MTEHHLVRKTETGHQLRAWTMDSGLWTLASGVGFVNSQPVQRMAAMTWEFMACGLHVYVRCAPHTMVRMAHPSTNGCLALLVIDWRPVLHHFGWPYVPCDAF